MKKKAITLALCGGILAALIAWLLQRLPPIPLCCVEVSVLDVLKSRSHVQHLAIDTGLRPDHVSLTRWKALVFVISRKFETQKYGTDDRADPPQDGEGPPLNQTLLVVNRDAIKPYVASETGSQSWMLDTKTLRDQGACKCERFSDQQTVSRDAPCTAFVLDDHHAVTASHCIEDSERLVERRFVRGFYGRNGKVPLQYGKERVLLPQRVVYRSDPCQSPDEDVVIVRFAEKIGAQHVRRASQTPKSGSPISFAGYPLGLPGKRGGPAKVRKNDPRLPFFVANIDGYDGNSGSPVFNAEGDVVGMHVRGVRSLAGTCGCLTSTWCADEACKGEEITRIDRIPIPDSLYESGDKLKVEPKPTNQCPD